MHIGGARTALYNWLQARHAGGALVLRIEDTDRERSTEENFAQIIDALRWLELDWDEGPVSQFGRDAQHRAALEKLIASGAAYLDSATSADVQAWKAEQGARAGYRGPSGETPREGGSAVRLRVPDSGDTVVSDVLRGPVSFPNASMDDFVIARGDGSVLYNFAVAVDDAEMGINEVIRGDDHLSNTPKQLLVLEALGYPVPRYAHLPLLHGPDGKKLSKRHGAASVQELRTAGYLPAAVRNYIALLGWGTDDDTTIMDTEELVRRFSIEDAGTASAVFDEKKLRWINGRYMREMPLDSYTAAVHRFLTEEARMGDEIPPAEDPVFRQACHIAQEKAQTLEEVWPLIRFAFVGIADDPKAWKKVMKDEAAGRLELARDVLAELDTFDVASIESALEPVVARLEISAGKVYQPIRVAITGTSVSPGIFESLSLLGQEESIRRIDDALGRLREAAGSPS